MEQPDGAAKPPYSANCGECEKCTDASLQWGFGAAKECQRALISTSSQARQSQRVATSRSGGLHLEELVPLTERKFFREKNDEFEANGDHAGISVCLLIV